MYPKHIIIFFIFSFFLCYFQAAVASDPDTLQDYCVPDTKHYGTLQTSRIDTLPCKKPKEVTPEDFVFSGAAKCSENFSDTGLAAVYGNPTVFPGLNTLGMSLVRADLKAGGINPPHYHGRATEIAYVVRGRVYSGFVDGANRVFAKVIEEGEVMVFPRGLVHFQMNVGKTTATVFGCFNSQNPGVQKIPATMFGSGVNDELLEKAFGLSIAQISKIRKRFFPKKHG
ncbi:PREDICTED: germin-like protein subfamily 3 member 2 [Ipomoea nil]|uniref:germin-like protein subfamily 3 member 2 n=1 Tax=Ipomoea nil TaxID=35883 RepID=UPI0009010B30|nr:PREDICTED: germin-like protein subfamily 3 member 2 [Ipomoea nil]